MKGLEPKRVVPKLTVPQHCHRATQTEDEPQDLIIDSVPSVHITVNTCPCHKVPKLRRHNAMIPQ